MIVNFLTYFDFSSSSSVFSVFIHLDRLHASNETSKRQDEFRLRFRSKFVTGINRKFASM